MNQIQLDGAAETWCSTVGLIPPGLKVGHGSTWKTWSIVTDKSNLYEQGLKIWTLWKWRKTAHIPKWRPSCTRWTMSHMKFFVRLGTIHLLTDFRPPSSFLKWSSRKNMFLDLGGALLGPRGRGHKNIEFFAGPDYPAKFQNFSFTGKASKSRFSSQNKKKNNNNNNNNNPEDKSLRIQ